MRKLSYELIDAGFRPCLGTIELPANIDHPETVLIDNLVLAGVPFTRGRTRDVCFVYDERGIPWFKTVSQMTDANWSMLEGMPLKRAAHIPHNDDAGVFATRVAPLLMSTTVRTQARVSASAATN